MLNRVSSYIYFLQGASNGIFQVLRDSSEIIFIFKPINFRISLKLKLFCLGHPSAVESYFKYK